MAKSGRSKAHGSDLLREALDDLLTPVGFRRYRRAFNRTPESGVTHVVEVVSSKGVVGVALGICFDEVIALSRKAGPDWGLFVGDNRFDNESIIGHCQIINDIGRFRATGVPYQLSPSDLQSADTVKEICDLIKDHGLRSLDLLGTRDALLANWQHQVLPTHVIMEFDRAEPEGRQPSQQALELEVALRKGPKFSGLLFWGSPVVTVAVVANRLNRCDYAAEVLKSEISAVRETKPKYAEHLRRVALMLKLVL